MESVPRWPSPEHASGLQALGQALRAGKTEVAAHVFQELAGLSSDPDRLGTDLALVLRSLYDDFCIAPLMAFTSWLGQHPAREIARHALQPFEQVFQDVQHWRRVLGETAGERSARDLRAQVRSRDVEAATATAGRILAGASSAKERRHRARQVGMILGSLSQDLPRTRKIMDLLGKQLGQIGLDASDFALLRETHESTQAKMSLSEMREHERQWNLIHTDAVVELMRKLPGRSATGQKPTAEEQQRFYDALHVMLAAYYHDQASLGPVEVRARFLDLARLLREFCPTDPRAAGPVQGVEEVAFLRMAPTDKLVSVRALRQLGQNATVVQSALQTAKVYPSGRAREILLYVMGGLSNAVFYPHLARALEDRELALMHDVIVDSLGRIADKQSLALLQRLLTQFCQARVIDPPARRRITNCLAALGRIARHPDTSAERRNAIVLRAFHALPDDRPLGRAGLQHLCAWNPGGLSPEVKRLAIGHAVDNLWTLDARTKLGRVDPNEETELGFREQVVGILVAMGRDSLPMLIEAADPRALQYSGAFVAIAEVLTKIGDERTLPFLEKILLVTLRTDETAIPEHLRETYYDAAQEDHVPLTRDKIAYSLVYAIHKTCGARGEALLSQLARRVQAREFESPGEQTMGLLAKIFVSGGPGVGPVLETVPLGGAQEPPPPTGEGMSLEEEMSGTGAFLGEKETPTAAPPPAELKRPRESDPLQSLLKDIRGKVFLRTKIEKRVTAIQEVAARGETEAIAALCDLLEEKDKILATAGETALLEIVSPRHPQPVFRHALYSLLECLRGVDGRRVKRISLLIDRMRPEREPLKGMLLGFIDSESEERLKKDVVDLFRIANERLARSGRSVDLSDAIGGGALQMIVGDSSPPGEEADQFAAAGGGPSRKGASLSVQDKVALRREYFAARKAWIVGGKRGPEPPRPPGI